MPLNKKINKIQWVIVIVTPVKQQEWTLLVFDIETFLFPQISFQDIVEASPICLGRENYCVVMVPSGGATCEIMDVKVGNNLLSFLLRFGTRPCE